MSNQQPWATAGTRSPSYWPKKTATFTAEDPQMTRARFSAGSTPSKPTGSSARTCPSTSSSASRAWKSPAQRISMWSCWSWRTRGSRTSTLCASATTTGLAKTSRAWPMVCAASATSTWRLSRRPRTCTRGCSADLFTSLWSIWWPCWTRLWMARAKYRFQV